MTTNEVLLVFAMIGCIADLIFIADTFMRS